MSTQPSAAAVRAANEIVGFVTDSATLKRANAPWIAEIVDRETHLPELVAFVEQSGVWTNDKMARARALLAKVKGSA